MYEVIDLVNVNYKKHTLGTLRVQKMNSTLAISDLSGLIRGGGGQRV